jgi:flagellar motor switch/type III secretory pathway protein FliN
MTLIMLAEAMEPILGVTASTNESYSQEQTKEIISRHINEVPVELTARLANGQISLYDMMNVEKDDVLVLRKKTVKPMEIMVNNHVCFRAYPAQCSGMYAAIIAD